MFAPDNVNTPVPVPPKVNDRLVPLITALIVIPPAPSILIILLVAFPSIKPRALAPVVKENKLALLFLIIVLGVKLTVTPFNVMLPLTVVELLIKFLAIVFKLVSSMAPIEVEPAGGEFKLKERVALVPLAPN